MKHEEIASTLGLHIRRAPLAVAVAWALGTLACETPPLTVLQSCQEHQLADNTSMPT